MAWKLAAGNFNKVNPIDEYRSLTSGYGRG
jgi:hypothetical protein